MKPLDGGPPFSSRDNARDRGRAFAAHVLTYRRVLCPFRIHPGWARPKIQLPSRGTAAYMNAIYDLLDLPTRVVPSTPALRWQFNVVEERLGLPLTDEGGDHMSALLRIEQDLLSKGLIAERFPE